MRQPLPLSTLRKISSLLVMCAVIASTAPISQAQNLKPAEKSKVKTLKSRLNKAVDARDTATSVLYSYNLFSVTGKIQSGDNNAATIYGTAVKRSNFGGLGALHDKSFLTVLSPADADLVAGGSYFDGLCTFVGAGRGTNTYVSVRSQPKYVQAFNEKEKWERITASIEAEINAVYLPYQQKAKNQATAQAAKQTRLAQLRRENAEAEAAIEAQNQARVNQAREKLGQEQRAIETAKQERFTKESADAEIARLEAEAAKARAEKARLDAEAQKQAKENAVQKAKELEERETKAQADIEVLKNTPSIIAGVQLGNVRLGMTDVQVLQLMGKPEVSLQLRKVDKASSNENVKYYVHFRPRKIRRDRYFLDATEGLNISYEGSAAALEYFAQERGINPVKDGDLKKTFVFDVFYLNGKVVQLESDSPQFFTVEKKNILSPSKEYILTNNAYNSKFIIDYRGRRNGATTWGEDNNITEFGSRYVGNLEKGISVCLESISTRQQNPPIPYPISLKKIIVHSPNTLPFTGDFQLGISLFNNNKQANYYDADNVEERMYDRNLNPTALDSNISNAVEPEKESMNEKIERGIGNILRGR